MSSLTFRKLNEFFGQSEYKHFHRPFLPLFCCYAIFHFLFISLINEIISFSMAHRWTDTKHTKLMTKIHELNKNLWQNNNNNKEKRMAFGLLVGFRSQLLLFFSFCSLFFSSVVVLSDKENYRSEGKIFWVQTHTQREGKIETHPFISRLLLLLFIWTILFWRSLVELSCSAFIYLNWSSRS